MLPRRYIERYLFFLLRHRWPVIGVIATVTVYFIYFMMVHMAIFTNFFDLYPPNHPYIQLYTKYRDMFGTANVVLITVEVKVGDIFTMPETIQEIVQREQDSNTTIYVTGFPILYAYFMKLLPQMGWVLFASVATMIVILWLEFRSWQGVWIPVFSGTLSAVWGLGFGGVFGLS